MAKIPQKYAKALFDVATGYRLLDDLYEEFSVIHEATVPYINALRDLDEDPAKDVQQRRSFVSDVYGAVNVYIKNMLYILADNRHLSYISDVFEAFQALYNQHKNQDFAVIESVYELSEDEIERLSEVIKQQTHLDHLIVTNKVNPSLIGGIRATVNTKVMDASVQNDLRNLEKQFIRVN
ncbi:F0F1 ATP synthase subunit delta [Staphylococcus sp. SQ8-PEA]|uniref:ATP synthase subunit delta n=1 Tax=Staphylococcus marylandisciuri TaxID=2981529 RepID=A0ABT2QRG0_9STAP|nr:F0F1 ATP synthase subunit delta [Staphylococcus marylandisciuri]MCU5746571.1 F0F1 ATP synthase subunit delta [Staphylococcus marylandisciuri]